MKVEELMTAIENYIDAKIERALLDFKESELDGYVSRYSDESATNYVIESREILLNKLKELDEKDI